MSFGRTLLQLDWLPDNLRQGADGDPFLIWDSGRFQRDRVLLFACPAGLRALSRGNTLFMDGNFSMAPKPFKQLYVMRTVVNHVSVTIGYALLSSKKATIYTATFRQLLLRSQQLGIVSTIRFVMTDFEDGAMRAATNVFGEHVTAQACLFHFSQVWLGLRYFAHMALCSSTFLIEFGAKFGTFPSECIVPPESSIPRILSEDSWTSVSASSTGRSRCGTSSRRGRHVPWRRSEILSLFYEHVRFWTSSHTTKGRWPWFHHPTQRSKVSTCTVESTRRAYGRPRSHQQYVRRLE